LRDLSPACQQTQAALPARSPPHALHKLSWGSLGASRALILLTLTI